MFGGLFLRLKQQPGLVLLLLIGISPGLAAQQGSFTINIVEDYQFMVQQKNVAQFFNQLYQSVNIKPRLISYPSRRGLKLVSEGKLDADAARFQQVAKHYSNIVALDLPLYKLEIASFCLNQQNCQLNANDTVAVLSGSLAIKNFCQQQQLNCIEQNDLKRALILFNQKKITSLLAPVKIMLPLLCQAGISEPKAFYQVQPKLSLNLYHYIHKQHEALLPTLNESLAQLQKQNKVAQVFVDNHTQSAKCRANIKQLLATKIN